MKITTIKLYQFTILFSVLILLTICKLSNKNSRKKTKFGNSITSRKRSHTKNNNPPAPVENPTIVAKRKCQINCDEALQKSKNGPNKTENPIKVEHHLFAKNKEIDVEYYLCECLLTSQNQIVTKEFYFANKTNVQTWFHNDEDGIKVYKKTLKSDFKKELNKEGNTEYHLVQ